MADFMSAMTTSRPRSLSPQEYNPFGAGFGGGNGGNGMDRYNPFDPVWSNPSPPATASGSITSTTSSATTMGNGQQLDSKQQLLEGLSLGLNAVPYRGQYQHLLVAN